jgi:hypothetical protein
MTAKVHAPTVRPAVSVRPTPGVGPQGRLRGTAGEAGRTFDEITRSVAVEEFVAYDQAIQQDPATPPPSWLEAAVVACG